MYSSEWAYTGYECRLDDIDRRILYELLANARDTSAPTIAEAVNVSLRTIRNRIDQQARAE